jgi:hypothetical protein
MDTVMFQMDKVFYIDVKTEIVQMYAKKGEEV